MASESSDDDQPLARSNGHLSSPKISRAQDAAMDRSGPNRNTSLAGLSERNGPVEDDSMEVDPTLNGGGKRKSRGSLPKINYKDESGSEGEPLAKRPKREASASDSDDAPIMSRAKNLPPAYEETALPDTSSDDEPLGQRLASKKAAIDRKPSRAPVKDDSESEPLTKTSTKKRKSNGAAAKRKSNGVKSESDSDVPIAKKAKAKTATPSKKAKNTTKAKKEVKKEDTPGEAAGTDDENAWWNAPKKEDDTIKWTTLEHNGVLFPPEHEPWPSNVKMIYDGKPITLGHAAEEVATFWVAMGPPETSQHVKNPVFRKNFFEDFREYVQEHGAKDAAGKRVDIKELEKCDFSQVYEYWQAKQAAKKARSKAEKDAAKAEKDKLEEPFTHCLWDGKKQKVGNFRVEPPSLFRGRGEHPKTGKVKRRVLPEQIIINIGKGAKVPEPPKGHKWKEVKHDQTGTWLAQWQENINNQYKYVMLAAGSDVKGQSDFKKFEKARNLKNYIEKIRKDYREELRSPKMAERQRATAMYLIDTFALRAGNEKDTDNEADTVGCCSLKFEHITLELPDKVTFDFLGKDSIRFFQTVHVDAQVFKNLRLFKKDPKKSGDDLFDRLTTTQLNKHLASYMEGLTAKVFRTYNASHTMSELLKGLHKDPRSRGNVAEKVKLYNDCNREVAVLCNHKRTVGAGHEQQMQKIQERIKGLEYQMWRTKKMMLDVDPKQKKKKGAEYFARPEHLDQEWVEAHQKFLVEEQQAKIEKKFEKDNEKLKAEKQRPMAQSELKERLKVAKELEAKFKKENKTDKVEAEGRSPAVDKLETAVDRLAERIRVLETQKEDRDGNKEVALGTSKINYIDPRLTVVFAKKFDVPLEKLFPKTLREKFRWAIASVADQDDWEF